MKKNTRRTQKPPKTPEHIDTERRVDMLRADLSHPDIRRNASLDSDGDGLLVWNSISKKLEDAKRKLAQHEEIYQQECRRARKRHRVP